jgi:hypothetical protein
MPLPEAEIRVTDTLRDTAVSGLYTRREWRPGTLGQLSPTVANTVRLDVDGPYPLMVASGWFLRGSLATGVGPVYWIARSLKKVGARLWEGDIRLRFPEPDYRNTSPLPHKKVRIRVSGGYAVLAAPKLTITFTDGAPDVSAVLTFESPYFREAEFEFDTVETAPRVTRIDTWAHPERPGKLRQEWLTIGKVYDRAGVDVRQSPEADVLTLGPGGPGVEVWNNQQLHDAMRAFWSRYQPRAQWALWVLFAHRHVDPTYNGIMFDFGGPTGTAGKYQRRGAAVFGEAVADNMKPDPYPGPALARRRFFSAIHEIGHCFNLGHSWEKGGAAPWVAAGGPDWRALSIMNYPERVEGFFAGFEYRFDDLELLFIRHAPEEFVEMGAAAAGQDHGDRAAAGPGPAGARPALALEIAVGRRQQVFEFLEPIVVELTLMNVSRHPQYVDPAVLDDADALSLVVEPRDGLARRWRPYARPCSSGELRVLAPGESLTTSLFVSAGLDGWHLAEPGGYTLRARLRVLGVDIHARPLTLRIASPRGWDDEVLAQNFFTDEVGRALAFGGTAVMNDAIEALREAADRLGGRAVACHASLALGLPLMEDGKVLRLPEGEAPMSSVAADGGTLAVIEARPDEARRLLREALLVDRDAAAETFGRRAYRRYVEQYARWLESAGDAAAGEEARAPLTVDCGAPTNGDAEPIGEGRCSPGR